MWLDIVFSMAWTYLFVLVFIYESRVDLTPFLRVDLTPFFCLSTLNLLRNCVNILRGSLILLEGSNIFVDIDSYYSILVKANVLFSGRGFLRSAAKGLLNEAALAAEKNKNIVYNLLSFNDFINFKKGYTPCKKPN
jgi:hypothetical protein